MNNREEFAKLMQELENLIIEVSKYSKQDEQHIINLLKKEAKKLLISQIKSAGGFINKDEFPDSSLDKMYTLCKMSIMKYEYPEDFKKNVDTLCKIINTPSKIKDSDKEQHPPLPQTSAKTEHKRDIHIKPQSENQEN